MPSAPPTRTPIMKLAETLDFAGGGQASKLADLRDGPVAMNSRRGRPPQDSPWASAHGPSPQQGPRSRGHLPQSSVASQMSSPEPVGQLP